MSLWLSGNRKCDCMSCLYTMQPHDHLLRVSRCRCKRLLAKLHFHWCHFGFFLWFSFAWQRETFLGQSVRRQAFHQTQHRVSCLGGQTGDPQVFGALHLYHVLLWMKIYPLCPWDPTTLGFCSFWSVFHNHKSNKKSARLGGGGARPRSVESTVSQNLPGTQVFVTRIVLTSHELVFGTM